MIKMEALFLVGVFIVANLIWYFIPTFIAMIRGHMNTGAIFATNLFLGWTVIGWIVAVIWSMTNNRKGAKSE